MFGLEELGLVVVVWGVTALIFRDWVVRWDLMLKERITGDFYGRPAVEEQERLLEKTARIVLAVGLVIFFAGVALHFTGLA